MTPDQALSEARRRELRPVYLVMGEEQHLQSTVIAALRHAALEGGVAGLNDDHWIAGEISVDTVIATARTLPMLGRRRLVLVRSLERWEPRSAPRLGTGKEDDGDGEQRPSEALDRLAEYAKSPSPSTTLVLIANKLDARRRLVTFARKEGFLVLCEPLARQELPGFVERAISERGSRVAPGVADLIAELAGPELAAVADAVERVTLFVGAGGEVTEDAVAECIVRLRPTTVWELVGAVGRRDVGAALRALHGVYDPQDRGLRLVGLLAWSTRQLLRFEAASRAGLPPPEAAKRAGAPPFKARELADQVRRFPRAELERWLEVLAGLDLALKGGSKRPPQAVLENAIIALSENRRERSRAPGMAKRSTPA